MDSPSEIARETLRQLALQKVPPTPDKYRELYFKIRGTPDEEIFPVHMLGAIAQALPRSTPAAQRNARSFEEAVSKAQWPLLKQAILDFCVTRSDEQKPWATLIRELITQFERRHDKLTLARKREALSHVLDANPKPDILYNRLNALVNEWSQSGGGAKGIETRLPGDSSAEAIEIAEAAEIAEQGVPLETPMRLLLSKLLADGIIPLAGDDELIVKEARALSNELLDTEGDLTNSSFVSRFERLVIHMERSGVEHLAVREALLDLLRLIIENIQELVIDDSWLHGQLKAISDIFAGPLSLRALDDVGQQLRDVIDKQSRLKRELAEAQDLLKEMLAGFVDHLAEVTVHTGDYHDLLSRSVRRISEATNIADLSEVVGELLHGTRLTQETAHRTGQELIELRERVDAANREIERLQHELDAASRLVRHDPLTGVLNRKGLSEAMTREVSRARRKGAPLCVALIDIDNFKKFNDVYGHSTGDDALRHLTSTVTETLRPQDVVARYGGEEFIILLPDTPPETANTILVRLQRELTKRIFCAPDSERLLITFSAGIALLAPDEDPEEAIARADEAMYAAKRAGKNRVLTAA
ncbi:MAG: GGDEF domain-containing protein [Azoarcus sp.]|nr:GGDEF domain-containing protein [Azoarcus sp.]